MFWLSAKASLSQALTSFKDELIWVRFPKSILSDGSNVELSLNYLTSSTGCYNNRSIYRFIIYIKKNYDQSHYSILFTWCRQSFLTHRFSVFKNESSHCKSKWNVAVALLHKSTGYTKTDLKKLCRELHMRTSLNAREVLIWCLHAI